MNPRALAVAIFGFFAFSASTKAGLSPLPHADPEVTYENYGARVSVVLGEMGKAVHLGLTASNAYKDCPLTVRFDKVPLSKAMERIASTLDGSWESSAGGYKLVPTHKRQEQAAEADRIAYEAGFYKSLRDLEKRATEGSESEDEDGNKIHVPPTAGETVVFSVIRTLPIERLIGLAMDHRLVYSTKPHGMQLPLPSEASPALEAWLSSPLDKYEGDDDTPKARGPVVKVNCSVGRGQFRRDEGVAVRVQAYDANGNVVRTAEDVIWPRYVEKDPADTPDDEDSTPLTLQPLTAQYFAFRVVTRPDGESNSDGDSALSPALDDRLRHPLDCDPSSFIGELFVRYAEVKGQQAVIVLPDEFLEDEPYYVGNGLDHGKVTAGLVSAMVRGEDTRVKWSQKDGWLVGYPADRYATFLDRAAIQRAFLSFRDLAHPSLAILASAYREGLLNYPNHDVLFPAFSNAYDMVTNALPLLASFDPSTLAALESGRTLPVGALDGDAQGQIVKDFNSFYARGQILQYDDSLPADKHYDYQLEPTEVSNTPLPDHGIVSIKVDTDACLFPPSRDDSTYWTTDEVGNRLATGQPVPRFRLGTLRNYTILIQVAPGVEMTYAASLTELPAGAKLMALADLPEDLRSEIDKAEAEVKKEIERNASEAAQATPVETSQSGPP